MTGTIKTKKEGNGYGFISRDGNPTDLFFHANSVVGTTFEALKEGDAVSFEIEKGQNGKDAAVNVARA